MSFTVGGTVRMLTLHGRRIRTLKQVSSISVEIGDALNCH